MKIRVVRDWHTVSKQEEILRSYAHTLLLQVKSKINFNRARKSVALVPNAHLSYEVLASWTAVSWRKHRKLVSNSIRAPRLWRVSVSFYSMDSNSAYELLYQSIRSWRLLLSWPICFLFCRVNKFNKIAFFLIDWPEKWTASDELFSLISLRLVKDAVWPMSWERTHYCKSAQWHSSNAAYSASRQRFKIVIRTRGKRRGFREKRKNDVEKETSWFNY